MSAVGRKVITVQDLPQLFEKVAENMADHAAQLCEMDAKLGDGDLGLTMKKGFSALPDIIRTIEEEDLGKVLMKSGMKMNSVVPSTMGTLMGSGIMGGGKALVGKTEMRAAEFADFLTGFCSGLENRGKCRRGDCTVLDAFATALDWVKESLSENDLVLTMQKAVDGAKAGTEATKSMKPKFGKAAVHANAATGVPDQGAVAGTYMLEGMLHFVEQ